MAKQVQMIEVPIGTIKVYVTDLGDTDIETLTAAVIQNTRQELEDMEVEGGTAPRTPIFCRHSTPAGT